MASRLLLTLLGLLIGSAGCTRITPPEPATGILLEEEQGFGIVGEDELGIGESVEPSPYPLMEYDEAVREYRGVVNLLRVIPPTEAHQGIDRALRLLADAIALMPSDNPAALEEAADLIRDNRLDLYLSIPSAWETRQVKQALEVASGALLLAARGSYADTAGVLAAVQRLEDAIAAIDGSERLRAEREDVVRALELAGDALAQIRRVALREPLP